MYFSIFLTPIGCVYIEKTEKGVFRIAFPRTSKKDLLIQGQNAVYTKLCENDSFLKYEISILKKYFEGKRVVFNFPVDLSSGTLFQRKVWNKLKEIPYGECRSYKWVAEQIGNPKAARAVGMANNKNPLPPIIPCHRVIGANGKLVGYATGLHVKNWLLEMERRG
ncbi:MAG: methylated-DNA--[protein]-cysteine S-methyltransferase [Candidatus Kuenenia sp.]|nr:methylated-DNA--[protein]-cysteine S-methyltransferase [Candidatus Kuenenia hertensis]